MVSHIDVGIVGRPRNPGHKGGILGGWGRGGWWCAIFFWTT